MNKELKKIINHVIDHGIKSFEWEENGITELKWRLENNDFELHFDIDYFPSGNISYYLTLFKGNDVVDQLEITDKVRDLFKPIYNSRVFYG